MTFFCFFLHSLVANLCYLTWDRYNIAIVGTSCTYKYNNSITTIRPKIDILIEWLTRFAISLSLLV